jgi:hypothetical protein
MTAFDISKRTTLTAEDVLAAFVGAVDLPAQPPRESNGIEGTAEWSAMRWRERTFDPGVEGGGVSFGPKCEARVTKMDGVLTIHATVTTSVSFWFPSIFAALCFVTLFVATVFISPEDWKGPVWFAWLLPVGGALFVVSAFRQVRRTAREAHAFLEGLLQTAEAGNQRATRK